MNTTPARRKAAKAAMADAEEFIREFARLVRESGACDGRPMLAALLDEAKPQADALRKARINL
ncbi:MAG: hypothetical protein ACP5HU_12915 [Phycisphaerae bacterium]